MTNQDTNYVNEVNPDLDLCDMLIEGMKSVGFNNDVIENIKSRTSYKLAMYQNPVTQMTYLTLLLNEILINGPYAAPYQVRLALNMSKHPPSWAEDISTNILPFLKLNEEMFFSLSTH